VACFRYPCPIDRSISPPPALTRYPYSIDVLYSILCFFSLHFTSPVLFFFLVRIERFDPAFFLFFVFVPLLFVISPSFVERRRLKFCFSVPVIFFSIIFLLIRSSRACFFSFHNYSLPSFILYYSPDIVPCPPRLKCILTPRNTHIRIRLTLPGKFFFVVFVVFVYASIHLDRCSFRLFDAYKKCSLYFYATQYILRYVTLRCIVCVSTRKRVRL